jgi:hypothetical protein
MNAGGVRHHRHLDRGVRGQLLDDGAIEDDTGCEAADRRMFDTLEVLLTLHFMGGPVTLKKAVFLESLGTTIGVAAIFVPGSWGAQEGRLHCDWANARFASNTSCSRYRFVKRIPDFLVGLPGLLVWQVLEARDVSSRRVPPHEKQENA